MTDDKIAEIKERHEFISSRTAAFFFPETAWTAHDDRGYLLAEVERLQAVVATLEIVGKAADDERQTMRERIEQLHEIIENNGVPCVIRRLL